MTDQFRNIDLGGPQKVRISWRMELADDPSGDTPEDRDEGFWPSTDPDHCAYVVPDNFAEQQNEAESRMAAWKAGDWSYIGVIAVAEVAIPIGQGSFTLHTFKSAGLWGIESDCTDYIAEVYEEEKADLLSQLNTLGEAISTNAYLVI